MYSKNNGRKVTFSKFTYDVPSQKYLKLFSGRIDDSLEETSKFRSVRSKNRDMGVTRHIAFLYEMLY